MELGDRPFRIASTEGELVAETLIIATGASAKWLGHPVGDKLQKYGVSACATCDGALFKGRDLAVVGGGDTAMEEATFLTRFSPKVTVIHRRDEFRASRIMLDRARRNPKIELVTNAVVDEILGELPKPGVTGVRLRDTRDGATRELTAGGVFVAIGHEPNSKLFRGLLDMDEAGYISDAGLDRDEDPRRVRLRRRRRPRLPPGGHGRRHRLHGRHRRRTLPRALTGAPGARRGVRARADLLAWMSTFAERRRSASRGAHMIPNAPALRRPSQGIVLPAKIKGRATAHSGRARAFFRKGEELEAGRSEHHAG